MGTTYNVIVFSDYENLEQSIYDSFNSVNLSMSTYLKDSLINKVNYSDINEWVNVSHDFIEVLRYAVDTCIKSKGFYDVSIGKLVDSWGFGPLEKNQKPSLKDIQYLKTQVGCDSIEIHEEALAVKRKRDVALDFSSIAKGFAIDKVYKHLYSELKIENIFIYTNKQIKVENIRELKNILLKSTSNNNPRFIILDDIDQILKVLKKQARKYKFTPCMGRSHGIHAEPITFGLKLASFYAVSYTHLTLPTKA